jgi:hypothetical protein
MPYLMPKPRTPVSLYEEIHLNFLKGPRSGFERSSTNKGLREHQLKIFDATINIARYYQHYCLDALSIYDWCLLPQPRPEKVIEDAIKDAVFLLCSYVDGTASDVINTNNDYPCLKADATIIIRETGNRIRRGYEAQTSGRYDNVYRLIERETAAKENGGPSSPGRS